MTHSETLPCMSYRPQGLGFFVATRWYLSSLLSVNQAYSPSFAGIVAEAVGGVLAGAAGIFPFGLGRQAVVAAGLGREPAAVDLGGELRHADRRRAFLAHAERHLLIGTRGHGHGIDQLVAIGGLDLVELPPLLVEVQGPQLVFGPGDFVLFHPEGVDGDLVLRAFVGLVPLFRRRAAHQELAARGSAPS